MKFAAKEACAWKLQFANIKIGKRFRQGELKRKKRKPTASSIGVQPDVVEESNTNTNADIKAPEDNHDACGLNEQQKQVFFCKMTPQSYLFIDICVA